MVSGFQSFRMFSLVMGRHLLVLLHPIPCLLLSRGTHWGCAFWSAGRDLSDQCERHIPVPLLRFQ